MQKFLLCFYCSKFSFWFYDWSKNYEFW